MSSPQTVGAASTQRAAEPAEAAAFTPVGVDVGVKQLVAVATTDGTLDEAVVIDGTRARRIFAAFQGVTQRLQERGHSAEGLGDIIWRTWRRLRREFQAAADAVLDVARKHADPVVVLEDLPQRRQPLVAARHGDVSEATWFPAVQAVVADRVVDASVPVTYVSPKYTSQQCHACDLLGRLDDETIRCTTPDCPVGKVCRDRSAAVSIAKQGTGNG
jgi:transposase